MATTESPPGEPRVVVDSVGLVRRDVLISVVLLCAVIAGRLLWLLVGT
jgi:hypothetical protein